MPLPRATEHVHEVRGRGLVRGLLGVALIVSAATMGEWYWLLAPFGVFMIFTGAMGYCPAGMLFPEYKEEKITEKFLSYKMDK